MKNKHLRSEVFFSLCLFFTLLITAFVFWPALTGPFLFDDFPNLSRLGENGAVDSLDHFLIYVFGSPGTLGRPLAFLSFLLNDVSWPSDPWPFKYSNLLIHLLCGLLVFILARQLARLAGLAPVRCLTVALAVMAVWLLHPMHVSTMMQVVQRMTLLSGLFVLAGISAYLHARMQSNIQPRYRWLQMSLAVGLGTTLSILCKENGILLPVFVLVIEFTLLANTRRSPAWWGWSAVFLWLPVAIVAVFFADVVNHHEAAYARRPFTLAQRLLTEPRVLADYISQIFIPRMGGAGLFHEGYRISRGLFDPLATFFALAGLLGLVTGAICLRRRLPILAFAILWFVGGHILESSVIPLEIFFEHRNYLPMFGLVFAAVYYALTGTGKLRWILPAALVLFLVFEAVLSRYSSYVWSDERLLVSVWATENPGSFRAQQLAAKVADDHGELIQAIGYLQTAERENPNRLSPALQLLILDCLDGELGTPDWNGIRKKARGAEFAHIVLDSVSRLREEVQKNQCRGLTYEDLLALERALLENPYFLGDATAKKRLYLEMAVIYAEKRLLAPAIQAIDQAYAAQPDLNIALFGAEWELSAGNYERALEYIDLARNTPPRGSFPMLMPEDPQIPYLEKIILDAKKKSESGTPGAASKNTP